MSFYRGLEIGKCQLEFEILMEKVGVSHSFLENQGFFSLGQKVLPDYISKIVQIVYYELSSLRSLS